MLKRYAYVISIALACASVALHTTSALAQTPARTGSATPQASAEDPSVPPTSAADTPAPPTAVSEPEPPPSATPDPAKSNPSGRYDDGIVIWKTPDDAKVPFLLKFNINTQIRYLNTTDSPETFIDHLGVEREVHVRNDITVNRAMFILGGYVFDPRLRYSFTVWTRLVRPPSWWPRTSVGNSARVSRSPAATRVFPAAARSSTRSPSSRRSTEAWRTTSFGPASRRESGRTGSP
jgi:hypothetical protein